MIKKILILGYGSIGQKHKKALIKINKNFIFFLSNSKKTFTKKKLIKIDPDLIIICTPTNLHYKNLIFLNSIFNNKIIIVEKPLFHKDLKLKMRENNNKIFVGYNLRFHPIIQYLKKNIKIKKQFYIRAECFSYLPNWRKKHYTNNYSSKKEMGGGVANDLSHEVDFISWIFGDIKIKFKKKYKLSDLKISSEDTFILVGKIYKSLVNINLNFASFLDNRKIFIDEKNRSLECDLKKNVIKIHHKFTNKFNSVNFENTDSLLNMHKNIISETFQDFCTLKQAMKINKIIK